MNAGAYGGELSQVLTAITFLNGEGELITLPAQDCALTYRHTIFTDHPAWLILEAEAALVPGDPAAIKARMDELAQQRRSKQPLELPSAGSTFKRPEGHFAGSLIEQCGLKGVGIGGAQVSEKHAGFVVNRGGATADDVRRLIELIQNTVLRETGIALEPEVKFLVFEVSFHGFYHYFRPVRGGKEQNGLLPGGHGLLCGGQHARGPDPQICRAVHGGPGAL